MSRSDDTPSIERWDHPVSIRMVVTDIDHTLITDDHRLTERTVRSVRAARQRGVEVVLASSRPPLGMTGYLGELGLIDPEPFIALQGGLIATLADPGTAGDVAAASGAGVAGAGPDLRVLHSSPIPMRLARRVVAVGEAMGVSVNWYSGTRWFVSRYDDRARREAGVVGTEPVETSLASVRHDPEKILFIARDAEGSERLRELPLPAGVEATFSNNGYLEVTAAGVDKGSALRIVANAAGVPTGQVAAIGDGENDLAMFRAAGVGIAPANASAQVRQAAGFVTASNNADGVAVALEALLGPLVPR
ncbi:MAG TPA: Cof-type HAD-IIB family hydrolase, partial [Microbacteriaceae bacterium]|nr:Cof-type HAD-IIB family hydrolase [Microbacteriaceae bacterium]